jgi:hypothetical protein
MDDYSDVSIVHRMLVDRAKFSRRSEAPITYGELAERLGMPPFRGANWTDHPLSNVLGRLNDIDHAASRPFMSALLVSSDTRYSGKSFFRAAEQLRKITIPKRNRRQYWDDEFTSLLEYYRNPDA